MRLLGLPNAGDLVTVRTILNVPVAEYELDHKTLLWVNALGKTYLLLQAGTTPAV
jgi:hypothetical protein